jgi:hypothetical protein
MTIAGLTFTVSQSSSANREGSSLGIGSEFGTVALNSKSDRQLLSAELIVQNDGKSTVSKVQPAVYLSDNGIKDSSDTLLWTRLLQELPPGESTVKKFRLTLPDGVNGKGKYLVAVNNGGSEKDTVVYGPIE